jgi:CelD/BcsL family acetyltransferase involved in cellulose biosynthesis
LAVRAGDVEFITDAVAARDLAEEWSSLAAEVGRVPFGLPELALVWWETLGPGRLLIGTVRDRAGRLVVLAPWHERSIAGRTVVRWLGHGLGSVGEVLVSAGHERSAAALWEAVVADRRILDLVEYRHAGGGLTELRRGDAWDLCVTVRDRCPVVDLAGVDSAADVVAGRRSLRKKLARVGRRAADVDFSVDVVTDPLLLDAAWPELVAVSDLAEADRPRLDFFSPPMAEFTSRAFRDAAGAGALVVFVARVDGRAVAFDVAFRCGDVLADWMGRMDPRAADLWPGYLLLNEVIDWSCREGIGAVDLLLGESAYKSHWTEGGYDTLHVVGGRPGHLMSARSVVGTIDTVSRAKATVARWRR